jgi:hypothetical protein
MNIKHVFFLPSYSFITNRRCIDFVSKIYLNTIYILIFKLQDNKKSNYCLRTVVERDTIFLVVRRILVSC